MVSLRFTLATVVFAAMVSAMPAAVEKRLAAAPSPTIPPGFNDTGSGCFDAGDCFAYQYPDFAAQCISGKCYVPISRSNPYNLPTLPAGGAPSSSAPKAAATAM
ncbi:hypothetical protein FA10DRAFT_280206 [Acaromyces ingoldii]|uniref:CBM1 domain-containing protein n=1 Tax=Acaromyces ingoldii TaxID=215250 RepID=A0A316YJU7_9BASI|nr:hypothetical protein FA10DRAFT_280206 [Acaromyces ingoldii]PWN89084.1 hypothetical protein FA10DRAFT_280206 [Acaromyces ingoldii]